MKKLRVLTMGCFVIFSVFLVTGSAFAVPGWTLWTPVHTSVEAELKVNWSNPYGSFFEAGEEFGMYAYNDNTNLYPLLNSTNIPSEEVVLTYNFTNQTFSNGLDASGSGGVIAFYYKSATGSISYDLVGFYSAADTYIFDDFSDEGVKVHDIKPATVPIPATALLFTSGFAGLIGFRRRKK